MNDSNSHGPPIPLARKIERWPLARLIENPNQGRYFGDLSEDELKALMEDLAREGQLQPIECLPDGTVLCGHQRWRAARELGWNEVDVWVREDLARDPVAAEQRFIRDNLVRRQLRPLQRARCIMRLKETLSGRFKVLQGESREQLREELGRLIGMSGRNVDRHIATLEAPEVVQQAYEQGMVTLVEAARAGSANQGCKNDIERRVERDGVERLRDIIATVTRAPHRSAVQTDPGLRMMRYVEKLLEIDALNESRPLRLDVDDQARLDELREWLERVHPAPQPHVGVAGPEGSSAPAATMHARA